MTHFRILINRPSLRDTDYEELMDGLFEVQNLLSQRNFREELTHFYMGLAKSNNRKGILGSLGEIFGAGNCVKGTLNTLDTVGYIVLGILTAPTGVGAVVNGSAAGASYGLALKQAMACGRGEK